MYKLFTNKMQCCGELATPLLTVKPVGVYSITLVQYLYMSCYLSDNKPVLSHLLFPYFHSVYFFVFGTPPWATSVNRHRHECSTIPVSCLLTVQLYQ